MRAAAKRPGAAGDISNRIASNEPRPAGIPLAAAPADASAKAASVGRMRDRLWSNRIIKASAAKSASAMPTAICAMAIRVVGIGASTGPKRSGLRRGVALQRDGNYFHVIMRVLPKTHACVNGIVI